jgi:hypothetical protein
MACELRAGGAAPPGLRSVQVPATVATVVAGPAAVELVNTLVEEVPTTEGAVVTAEAVVVL